MLEFRDISVNYGTVTAIKDLSLTVRPGELMTLLGPSGCGKSTLLRTAAGFLAPCSGSVWVDGENVTNLPPEARPTATVFQSHALFPHKNVGENVVYGLLARGTPRNEAMRRASDMLAKVGLGGTEQRRVQDLSGGQQQRVALARALVINPKVLLLDEPLSSLDAELRVRLREEIRHLQQDLGMTALYVTHDREEALSISDRVAVMRPGHIAQLGTPEDVYGKPADEFVARFVSDANVFKAAAGGLVFVRPGEFELDGVSSARGIVKDRQFKGEVVTYMLKMSREAPDIPVRSVGEEKREFARIADREVRVDVPTPEARPMCIGDEAGVKLQTGYK